MKLGRNLFSKLSLDPERQVHDLYSFGLGAFIMILLSTLLNTITQKYQVVRADGGRINWMHVKDYIVQKMLKVRKKKGWWEEKTQCLLLGCQICLFVPNVWICDTVLYWNYARSLYHYAFKITRKCN